MSTGTEAPESSVRFSMVIAFLGTAYAGWQRQHGVVTVQERIEQALAALFPSKPAVHGSSRTDAGVHAHGMVAHCDVPRAEFRMTPRKLVLAMNAHLPPDIRVLGARRRPAGFHARFDATGKQYRYRVWTHPAHHPLWLGQAWHVPRALDLSAMREAARDLVGTHDFRAFSTTPGYERLHTVRTVRRCSVHRSGPMLTFVIGGDGFLYRMCRGIVGTLVQVGVGRFSPEIGRAHV